MSNRTIRTIIVLEKSLIKQPEQSTLEYCEELLHKAELDQQNIFTTPNHKEEVIEYLQSIINVHKGKCIPLK